MTNENGRGQKAERIGQRAKRYHKRADGLRVAAKITVSASYRKRYNSDITYSEALFTWDAP
jgi:hypothetical protein